MLIIIRLLAYRFVRSGGIPMVKMIGGGARCRR